MKISATFYVPVLSAIGDAQCNKGITLRLVSFQSICFQLLICDMKEVFSTVFRSSNVIKPFPDG